MAKLSAVVDSLDEVPEALRELYVEQDGKFVLDADVEGHPGIGALKRSLEAERKRRLELTQKYDGVDPEKYQRLLELEEEHQKGKLTDKQREEFDSLKRQLGEQHQKELARRDERIKGLETALRRELITSRATTAIAAAKGSVRLLLPHVEKLANVVEQDGRHVPVIVDEQGHTRLGEGGANMSFDELVAELRASKDFAGAFEGTGSSGGGAPARPAVGGGGSGPKKVVARDDNAAFLANVEDIAKGTAEVRGP